MIRVNERKLESDVGFRFQYLTEFIGFGTDDIAAIHAAAPVIAPMVPTLVNAVYDKLHTYDATWRHFVPRQFGYEGPVPNSLAIRASIDWLLSGECVASTRCVTMWHTIAGPRSGSDTQNSAISLGCTRSRRSARPLRSTERHLLR
jgi:hypothetical protein